MTDTEHPLPIAQIIHALQEEQGWLFDEAGFRVTYSSLAGRYQSDPSVGLSNGRLQMLLNSEIALPLLACPGSRYVNRYDEDPAAEGYRDSHWQDSIMLFNYLDHLPHRYGRDAPGEFLRRVTWQKIRERLPELERMFADEATMWGWMPDFVRYLGRFNGYIPPAKREWLRDEG